MTAASGGTECSGEPPASPCVAVCRLGDDGICAGCFRSLEEIAQWTSLSPAGRRRVIEATRLRRTAAGEI